MSKNVSFLFGAGAEGISNFNIRSGYEFMKSTLLAFDADINIRFSSIITRARLVGANTDRLVGVEAGAELFTSGAPVVL